MANHSSELKNYKIIKSIVDLNNPEKWFPEARKIKRKIYYHMGPTNSGKTFFAIKSLIQARNGLYCAPLRLLAWEIQEKLTLNSVKCNLITGQEQLIVDQATHISCTVEKCDTKNFFDCAVIDEIQMIDDPSRGPAWTEAFLGIQANEIHLCGDPRSLNLIKNLCLLTGDTLIKKNYNRLGRLEVEAEPLTNLKDLRLGDCVIDFSKISLLALRKKISNHFKDKNSCAVIYGSLPPKYKKNQISEFNNESTDVKYLCATDAIGLGLNLNIKRIIFASLEKRIKFDSFIIPINDVKQIAGRAGRSHNVGYVTAFNQSDLQIIRKSLQGVNDTANIKENHGQETSIISKSFCLNNYALTKTECEIKHAVIFPPVNVMIEFRNLVSLILNRNDVSLSELIKAFKYYSDIGNNFLFREVDTFFEILTNLETVEKYDIRILFHFLNCPIKLCQLTKHYHRLYLQQFKNDFIVKLPTEFEIKKEDLKNVKIDTKYLNYLQDVFNCIEIYIFLSFRFENNFIERTKADELKDRIAELIEYIIEDKLV